MASNVCALAGLVLVIAAASVFAGYYASPVAGACTAAGLTGGSLLWVARVLYVRAGR